MIKKYSTAKGETRYMLKTYLGINPKNGKEIHTTRRGFKSKKEAKIIEAKLISEFRENQALKKCGKYRFEEVYKEWLEVYENTVKENTFVTNKMVVEKHIIPRFGEMFIDKITIQDYQSSVNKWYKTYTKATHLISLTNRIIDFGISRGYLKDNNLRKVVRPRNTHRKEKQCYFYDKATLIKFLDCVEKEYGLFGILLFRLLAYTGLRKGELLGLMWEDLDEIKQNIRVNRVLVKGKNNRYLFQSPKTKASRRVISLDQKTLYLLRRWRLEQKIAFFKNGIKPSEHQLIFTDNFNHHIPTEVPNRRLNCVLRKYNLPKITIHGFRHTHCSLLFEAGLSMEAVKNRLGHASIQTTLDIYTHITENRENETANLFARFMEI